MEAIPGAAVLSCFGLVRSGRCGVVCGGGMMPVRGGRRNVVAMTGMMQLCGRYDAVARTLGN